jgi:hypothetical protein
LYLESFLVTNFGLPILWIFLHNKNESNMEERSDADKVCCERLARNDPNLVDICVPLFRSEHLKTLSLSLPKSNFVTSVSFDVTADGKTKCYLYPMLQYLRETTFLQSVQLTSTDLVFDRTPNAYAASLLIQAIADNAHLALVQFSSSCVPLHARDHHLLDLLQNKASSLRHLTLQQLRCCNNARWPEHDAVAFASAVGALTLLQSLTIEEFPNPGLLALTLRQLGSHTYLQKLSITGYCLAIPHDAVIVNAVSAMLQSSVPLEVLELRKLYFSQANMESLVLGLESCLSLVDLALEGYMDDDAKQEMLRFLRADRSMVERGIRRLHLKDTQEAPGLFNSVLTGDIRQLQPSATSIGASLHTLSLPYLFYDIGELLNALVTGGHRLSSLSLDCLTDYSWSQLNRSLPDLVHLQELHIQHLYGSCGSSMDFVRAMQKNRSLYQVPEFSRGHAQASKPLFSAPELQKILSYCQRNREMRELLQKPCLPCDDTCVGNLKTSLSLFPILFHVMKPVQTVAPNSVFVGLLACSRWIGPPCSPRKRLGPHS